MLIAEGNARSRNLLRRFGNVVEFPLQYLAENILHVLNLFGSVYGEDDVSFI